MALSCLLDENFDPKVATILTILGREAAHVTQVLEARAPDEDVLAAAADFDALVTIDLFRQPREWQAAKRAMLAAVRIVRVRFRSTQHDDALAQARALLWRWREIETVFESRPEIRLATLAGETFSLRLSTDGELRAMRGPRADRSQPS